jgi:hypothetical protein
VAERAGRLAYSHDEVNERIKVALAKDFAEAPLAKVRDILSEQDQKSLFPADRIAQLDEIRASCRGSAVANTVIDCAIEAVHSGLTGGNALRAALENAASAHLQARSNQIEEHCLRNDPKHGSLVRARLRAARAAVSGDQIASEMMSGRPAKSDSRVLHRHDGVDDGPAL